MLCIDGWLMIAENPSQHTRYLPNNIWENRWEKKTQKGWLIILLMVVVVRISSNTKFLLSRKAGTKKRRENGAL